MRLIYPLLLVFLLISGCAQDSQVTELEEKMQELEEKIESIEESVVEVEERVETLEYEMESLNNISNESKDDDETSLPPKGTVRFQVTIENVHDSQTLSPGVFIVHKPPYSINYIAKLAPAELEPLAEYGDNTAFRDFVNESSDVLNIYAIDEPILPGESVTFTLDVSTYMPRESYLSGIQMAVGSNDGFALAHNIALFDPGNGPKASITDALNFDAGTEENSVLLSGFEGGQPDASRGAENIDNGVSTSLPVTPHTQLTDTIMRVTVTPQ
jgi:hypothetical protein